VSNGQKKFASRGLRDGVAAPESYNDAHVHVNSRIVAGLENKGSEASLLPAVAQSAVSATNYCIGLMASGIPIEDCVVAVVSNNGVSMCFGATILLHHSFPTYIPLSKQLDLLDDRDSRVAYAYLNKILEHRTRYHTLRKPAAPVSVTEMALSLDRYFVKKITNDVFARGLGLFVDSNERKDIQSGLNHMIRCLNRLYDSRARDVAEYPISVRTPDDEYDYFEIIYRDLVPLGFVSGTPNRIREAGLYGIFVRELKRCITLVHTAGVIHVDLYASNIMWRRSTSGGGGGVEIKIMDWDVAHCLEEEDFAPNIKTLLEERIYYAGKIVTFDESHDLRYISVFDMPIKESHMAMWEDMASGNKCRIDSAFRILMHEATFPVQDDGVEVTAENISNLKIN
jgi:hypothetical protein